MIVENSSFSQNLQNIDLKTIKVDQLTDDQIKSLLKKATETGMTQEQLETIAINKGMPTSELNKLRDRINNLKLSETQSTTIQKITERKQVYDLKKIRSEKEKEKLEIDTISDVFSSLLTKEELEKQEKERKVFGYELFNTRNLTFEPSINIPTPQNYQIGPGDELLIDVWGASQQNYKLTVSPEGTIFIDNVGPINVNGLTIEKATTKIINKLSNIYAGLAGPNPNTYAQVSLGNLRSIKVSVVGEVNTPGTYTLPSLATVFNALYVSGGPSFNGSFRNIEVYRDNKLITKLDVYDFLIKGDNKNNIRLQDQDIIMIKPYKTRVEIKGETKRTGFFEVIDNDNLNNLLTFAGGFTERAYSLRVKVIRNSEKELKILDVFKDQFNNFSFCNGDQIIIEPIINRFENRVEISGSVYRPGFYSLEKGMSVKKLIEKADGLRGDAFIYRAMIFRQKEDLSVEALSFSLDKILKGDTSDILLNREDLVRIFSIYELQENFIIKTNGELVKPDTFPYVKNITLADAIALSGGFKESASMARIEVSRRLKNINVNDVTAKIADVYLFNVDRNLSLSDSASNFILQPFDDIFVRKSPSYEPQLYISIVGEVMYPGKYTILSKNDRISDIINRCGGLTKEAYPKGAKLKRKRIENTTERGKMLKSLQAELEDTIIIEFLKEKEEYIGIDLEKILNNPHSEYDLLVQDGDMIEIPKELQTVRLSGALLYPITVRYDKKYSVRDYISMAGGYNDVAIPRKTYVIYANGSVKKTSSFLGIKSYPEIEPGAEIIVPSKARTKEMTPQEILGISTALTSLALIVVTLIGKL